VSLQLLENVSNTAAGSNFWDFWRSAHFQLQNMAGPYFGSFGARGRQPTSFGPRDTLWKLMTTKKAKHSGRLSLARAFGHHQLLPMQLLAPGLHSPLAGKSRTSSLAQSPLACRVFLIKKPYSSSKELERTHHKAAPGTPSLPLLLWSDIHP
jgi:hypothetical protein